MIDLKSLRSDPEAFRAQLAGKRVPADLLDKLLAVDEEYRELLTRVEALRRDRNETTEKIKGAAADERPAVIAQAKELKEALAVAEARFKELEPERLQLWLAVPNPAHESVPRGASDVENTTHKVHGEKPAFDFEPLDHVALAERHGWMDLGRAAKVSGSRFVYLHGDLVELQFALIHYAFRLLRRQGFLPTVPPSLVREAAMEGTGFFPADKFEIYKVDGEDQYLTGTSEVPLAGLHMDEILDDEALPRRYAGYSSCYRKEAGAAGKDTKGMFRLHQFDKVEMFSFCRPEESWAEHERLLAIEEEIMQGLGLHYRVVNVCDGDLGAPAAKKYDLEAWFPGQGQYRELTSCSNCTDFQARRLKARYKDGDSNKLVHTLNGTAVAIGRTLIAVLETHQRSDGSVRVPEVLRPFLFEPREFLGA